VIVLELFADYHTHSQYSHGKGNIVGNIEVAIRKGLEAIAITDHGPAMAFGLGVKRASDLLQIKAEIRQVQQYFPQVKVLAGVEANILNEAGDLDVPTEILAQLDLVLVGLHPNLFPRLESLRLLGYHYGGKLSRTLNARARKFNTQALVNAVQRHPVDIVTHPGLKLAVDTKELAQVCAARGTALEINSSHGYLTTEFVQVAVAAGVKFAINSDAHRPEDVGNLAAGLAIAEKVGLTAADIINARYIQ
jgi:putative hydrolase